MDHLIVPALATPLLPLAAFVLPLLFARRRPRLRAGVSIAAAALAFLCAAWVLSRQVAEPVSVAAAIPWLDAGKISISIGILVDPLSSLMAVIVAGVSLLVQVYSLGYMRDDPSFGRFFSYLSLFAFSMLVLVLADDFILLYIAWELVGLCSYLLIGFWYQKPEAARAAKKAFVVTRVGDLGFLIGILFLSITAGSFDFGVVTKFLGGGSVSQGRATLVALLLFCGAMGRAASSRSTSGSRTPWKAPLRYPPSSTPPPWWRQASTWWPGSTAFSRPSPDAMRVIAWPSARSRRSSPRPSPWPRTISSACWRIPL